MTYYAFVNPRALCDEARCKLCRPWLKGRERLPARVRRQVQDDPRLDDHEPLPDGHLDGCQCAACMDPDGTVLRYWHPSRLWPPCKSPPLRRPLGPLLRAAA